VSRRYLEVRQGEMCTNDQMLFIDDVLRHMLPLYAWWGTICTLIINDHRSQIQYLDVVQVRCLTGGLRR